MFVILLLTVTAHATALNTLDGSGPASDSSIEQLRSNEDPKYAWRKTLHPVRSVDPLIIDETKLNASSTLTTDMDPIHLKNAAEYYLEKHPPKTSDSDSDSTTDPLTEKSLLLLMLEDDENNSTTSASPTDHPPSSKSQDPLHSLSTTPEFALQVALTAKDLPRSACRHDTCGDCTTDPECGWCEVRGKCMEGDTLGPSPGIVQGPCTLWSFGGCIGTDCRNLETCSDCTTNSDCGWCEDTCQCTDRIASDPTTPAYGECNRGWFVAEGESLKT